MVTRARLAAVDEANFTLDHAGQVNVFLVAGLVRPGGFVGADGLPDMPMLRRGLSERIETLPQLCRVAVPVGRRHAWAELAPDLEHHVRAIPAVRGVGGLEQVCAGLMCVPLPRDRPLWELLVVPGATTDGLGIVLRIHHAIADGMSAVAIARTLFQEDAQRAPAPVPSATRPAAPGPSLAQRSQRMAVGLQRTLVTVINHGVGQTALLGPRSALHGVRFLDVGLGSLTSHVRPLGGTVNDALLDAVAAGYRAALTALSEPIPKSLPVSVPVALTRHEGSANQVGVMLVRLPLDETDADHRLRLIAGQTRREKPRARAQGTLELMRGPVGARIMDVIGRRQRLVAGFVTNVPGPSGTLRLCGAPVAAIWPVAVLAANVRSGVAALSYEGRLWCGIHVDAASIPGSAFAEGMAQELIRLTT
ncbi:wax ester/triacylglycerol synthase domain-containing protein [Microbacterium sp. ZW CA_36]|uniref:wax ester/triacylglycerol synthase domain-containing protein n=1 Tax=Microbacterium sp. ZW CA_36 TaxID=3378078 RepID=UPI0038537A09